MNFLNEAYRLLWKASISSPLKLTLGILLLNRVLMTALFIQSLTISRAELNRQVIQELISPNVQFVDFLPFLFPMKPGPMDNELSQEDITLVNLVYAGKSL